MNYTKRQEEICCVSVGNGNNISKCFLNLFGICTHLIVVSKSNFFVKVK